MNLIRIVPLMLLLLLACGKQKEETATTPTDTLTNVSTESTEPTEEIVIPDPTDPLLIEYKNFVWNLDKSNPYSVTQATKKYEELFRGKSTALADTAIYWFEKLYASVTNSLNEHMQDPERYDSLVIREEGLKLSKFLTDYRDSLAANGHRVTMEEGMSYIEQNRAFMEKTFYPHVSPAMVQYLTQVNKEHDEGFTSDAGLVIEPETLAMRIGWWEEFYKTNPNFIFQDGKDWANMYVNVLMTGTDNTPLYWDREDGKKPKLEEYYVKAYTTIFTKYPKSKATKLLEAYYDLLVEYDTARAKRYREMEWED